MSDVTTKQLDILISLLARRNPGIEKIHEIVTRGKRDPDAYVRVYNTLDGTVGVTEAAKNAKVSQPNMTRVLQGWEVQGIIYDIGEEHKPQYKRLTILPQRIS